MSKAPLPVPALWQGEPSTTAVCLSLLPAYHPCLPGPVPGPPCLPARPPAGGCQHEQAGVQALPQNHGLEQKPDGAVSLAAGGQQWGGARQRWRGDWQELQRRYHTTCLRYCWLGDQTDTLFNPAACLPPLLPPATLSLLPVQVSDWGDLSYLLRPAYEASLRSALAEAEPWEFSYRRDAPKPQPGHTYLVPYTMEQYSRLAMRLSLWPYPRGHHQHVASIPWG
jgi:hypothetical protein